MNQLENHGQIDVARANIARGSSGQESQGWPQPFAATAARVSDIALDGRIKRARLFANTLFDRVEVWINQLNRMLHFPGSETPESRPGENFHQRRLRFRISVVNWPITDLAPA